jgi:hypothetical protein
VSPTNTRAETLSTCGKLVWNFGLHKFSRILRSEMPYYAQVRKLVVFAKQNTIVPRAPSLADLFEERGNLFARRCAN